MFYRCFTELTIYFSEELEMEISLDGVATTLLATTMLIVALLQVITVFYCDIAYVMLLLRHCIYVVLQFFGIATCDNIFVTLHM